jgi:undecaprenyl diphosphate synthase
MSEKPQCIGIILDGNRRWAKERGLSSLEGHREGLSTLKTCIEAIAHRSIPHLVVFAFSSENWGRADEEVGYLMELMADAIRTEVPVLREKGIAVRVIGDRTRFPPDMRAAIEEIDAARSSDPVLTVWVCLSYGSRAEIVAAANALIKEGREVDEPGFARHLWSAGMPDPDIIIRTGGRRRISNFLLWQAAYAELFFLDSMWPDFRPETLDAVLEEYAARVRTYGL